MIATNNILSREPLYLQVKKALRSYINTNRPKTLPTEQKMVEQFRVSKTTIRKAVQDLTEEGRVRPVQGSGIHVLYQGVDLVHKAVLIVLRDFIEMEAYQKDLFIYLDRYLSERKISPIVRMLHTNAPTGIEGIASTLNKVDGVILCSPFHNNHELFNELRDFHSHIVTLLEKSNNPYNCVLGRVDKGYEMLVHHLYGLGHRDMAYVGHFTQDRKQGLEKGFAECGINLDPLNYIDCLGFRHKGYEGMKELLARGGKFTAVIAHNDDCAHGIMECLMEKGIRIPDDMSLVGYDNLRDTEFFPVPLTSCGPKLSDVAKEALDMILSPKEGQKSDEPEIRYLEPELVIRQSSGPPK
jgi:DNA-binding LacI/PurR family transcriptional regulator